MIQALRLLPSLRHGPGDRLIAFLFGAVTAVIIFARNPVHSVLWLILAFFNAAGLMVLAGAEFIAMLLVIVYVGAVAVLFLFVVMMLNIDFAELRAGFIKNFPLGITIALVLLAELVLGIGAYRAGDRARHARRQRGAAAGESNIENARRAALRPLPVPVRGAGMILLVAMIGAIVLTHRERKRCSRPQNIGKQIRRRPEDATVNTRPEVGKGVEL
jgi:NADH-quinone oxidoreductase subunit J